MAACHLKLEAWKEAAKASSEALDGLEKLQKDEAPDKKKDENGETEKEEVKEEEEADEEIISEGATKAEDTRGKNIDDAKESRAKDIERIRAKALMRRARARSEQDGWSTLAGAVEGTVVYLFPSLATSHAGTPSSALTYHTPHSRLQTPFNLYQPLRH